MTTRLGIATISTISGGWLQRLPGPIFNYIDGAADDG